MVHLTQFLELKTTEETLKSMAYIKWVNLEGTFFRFL